MSFAVAGEAYDRYIGRYSRLIAPRFLEFAGVAAGPVLDVGCGPGSLTEVLAARFGATSVKAVDPSDSFVAACRARVPGADVRRGSAEQLPFADQSFQGALSQLVLSFISDAERAAAEMRRVLRPGGAAAACTFESGGFALVKTFWEAARGLDPAAIDDARLPFRRTGELVSLWKGAGFRDVATEVIEVAAEYRDFDDYWGPFAFGIGPAGEYLKSQPGSRQDALREACFEILGRPARPFSLPARVIAVRGLA
ncbi:MAG TPA: methyltransferase domain-containing protein [Anaeromyxobacteraceae bacterium]|nr:methyltransferase domain-containing protein [Anaeromyxobacteraceae bacterium]